MSSQTLVTENDLMNQLDNPGWLVFDCRFNLADPQWGRQQFQQGHIPGARYIHLNDELSDKVIPGKTGRHPLPKAAEFIQRVANWEISKSHQVVIYDQREGMFAARLWWMLRWCGYRNVAVLDGGWSAWTKKNHPVSTSSVKSKDKADVSGVQANDDMCVNADQVLENIRTKEFILLDARSADRYRGENETIDPVAGHIPGAMSAPFLTNLNDEGRFLSKEDLRQRYQSLLGASFADRVVVYCGSGVTATHNILAMRHAGMGEAKLYPGSWSEWITRKEHPIALGE
jgi:thiosulfate/3-mercaptopyruvate sulfurtransferase